MASGVYRTYTAADVIGSLQGGIDAASASSTSAGTGYFTEADEVIGVTDTATVTTLATPTWSNGQWGQGVWG